MADLTATIRALADPTRLAILELLRDRSRSVTELVDHFSTSRPAVSKHLGILREAGLVVARRDGRNQIYELESAPLGPVREWLARFGEPEQPARKSSRPAARQSSRRDDWRNW